MTWDPEIDDPGEIRRRLEPPTDGGRDVGADAARDFGDEPLPAYRLSAPRPWAVDPSAPVSGHRPAPPGHTISEIDWPTAAPIVMPRLRPAGTPGMALDDHEPGAIVRGHGGAQPLLDPGPAGLLVAYVLPSGSFDVLVNGEHLRSWGIAGDVLREASAANLRAWSLNAAWTEEVDGDRRLVSSSTGDGPDASRILLPEACRYLVSVLGPGGRVLVGLPDRDLLVAGRLTAADPEFATMLAGFVADQAAAADEPIEAGLYELVNERLVPFAG